MAERQTVCTACSYNMIGERPTACPFCGASAENFLSDRECSDRHKVTAFPVNDRVTRLNSVPSLGIEHASYLVNTGTATVMIDSPSAFRPDLPPADIIAFTHKDFLGACNQYRAAFGAEVWIHEEDAKHPLAEPFPFDRLFSGDFEDHGLSARFVGGHSPGFTVFLAQSTLFTCDLVFDLGARTRFNVFGAGTRATRDAAIGLVEWLDDRPIETVCAWNYVTDYAGWKARLDALVETGRPVDRSERMARDENTRRFLCERCALVYDPILGLPEDGIAPGTPFADIPDTWQCPDCQVSKADFVPLD